MFILLLSSIIFLLSTIFNENSVILTICNYTFVAFILLTWLFNLISYILEDNIKALKYIKYISPQSQILSFKIWLKIK